ncbi:MAG: ABC transporter ATP-binding protein [Bdellovibrionales bacterium]|nr:ABC transporter ATP-binding protein [Bdellovibrionales bacterium]
MAPILALQGLRKVFGSCVANEDVTLAVRAGSVHAIVGENGAGKSTAMKMVCGLWRPDAGQILLEGREVSFTSAEDAVAAGIGMVHQHFMLAGPHTVMENILLGSERNALFPGSRAAARVRIQEIMDRYGLPVPLDARVEDLPVGIQQRVEILKVLYRDSRILILDEPTAVLTPAESQSLIRNLRGLQREGKTILLITHKLKEVMAFAEDITVFRRGRVVGQVRAQDTSIELLAEMMIGRRVVMPEGGEARPGDPVLEVRGLCGVDFSVRSGEIVGVAGVEGNGQAELIRALLFPEERRSGKVTLQGRDTEGLSTSEIRSAGMGVLAEDRLEQSLVGEMPLSENLLLEPGWRKEHTPVIRWARLREEGAALLENWDVRPRDLDAAADSLSGGNQQKFVVGRELSRAPRLILAAQPTRGVDVGAVEFIHRRLLDARDAGAGVLLFSSDLDEILRLSDRILVMFEGRFAAEFQRGEADEARLGIPMGGGS